jgi:hypothetical protein
MRIFFAFAWLTLAKRGEVRVFGSVPPQVGTTLAATDKSQKTP